MTVQHIGKLMRAMVDAAGMARIVKLIEILDVLASCHSYSLLASADYHFSNEINPVNRQRIETVHQYVRKNLSSDIKQAELAMMVGLKPPAFSRFFRAATGQTFVGFINLLRVNEACRLLCDSRLSVTTIAMECGYRNISNFNRQFLAVKGLNPTRYRDLVRRRDEHALDWPRLKMA
jgi:transcriptional regulator GlxA family with amidase domain